VNHQGGQFDGGEVDSCGVKEGSKRQTTLWFAKDFTTLLVRLNA